MYLPLPLPLPLPSLYVFILQCFVISITLLALSSYKRGKRKVEVEVEVEGGGRGGGTDGRTDRCRDCIYSLPPWLGEIRQFSLKKGVGLYSYVYLSIMYLSILNLIRRKKLISPVKKVEKKLNWS